MNFSNHIVGGMVTSQQTGKVVIMKLGINRLLKAYGYLIIFMAITYASQAVLAYASNNHFSLAVNIVTSIIWMIFFPIYLNYLKSLKKLNDTLNSVNAQIEAYKEDDRATLKELIRMTASCPLCHKKAKDLFEIRHGKNE